SYSNVQPNLQWTIKELSSENARPPLLTYYGRCWIHKERFQLSSELGFTIHDTDPMGVKRHRSKSVFFDASRLAKNLRQLEAKYGKDK
ncbi:unnamed protein product, partial [Brassica oleracea]